MQIKSWYFLMVVIASMFLFGCANVRQHVSRGNQKTLVESVVMDSERPWAALQEADEKFWEKFWQ